MSDPDLNNFERKLVPPEFYLGQNYPNPFSEKTTIKYCVAYKTRVQISVYNTEGEEIEKLVDEEKEAGTYEVVFQLATRLPDGQVGNRQLAKGNYYYCFEAGNYKSEKRMQLII